MKTRVDIFNSRDWQKFCKQGKRPSFIPSNPPMYYKSRGWNGWGDFTGSGTTRKRAMHHVSYEEAKDLAASLGFQKSKQWIEWAKTDARPDNVPSAPDKTYKGKGWISWSEFLCDKYVPYEEAKNIVEKLGFSTSKEYMDWAKTEGKSTDIPTCPHLVYKDKGWTGWKDFLNTYFFTYEEAREYAHTLNIKNLKEWHEWSASDARPVKMPSTPHKQYGSDWISWGDFLGTGRSWQFIAFEEARAFVRKLNLKSQKEWLAYCKSGKRPGNIPANPSGTYKDKWKDIGDWLGYDISNKFRPFQEAREFARNLKLKSQLEWSSYCKSGKKPDDIPSSPATIYDEWEGVGDWLGTGNESSRGKKFRPFKEARAFARSLQLKDQKEWSRYSKSGNRPKDIPSAPSIIYKNKGWKGMGDWLGTGNTRGRRKKK